MAPPIEPEKPCEVCNGAGVIDVDDLHSVMCNCARWRLMRRHLGPEIAGAKRIRESPLYKTEKYGSTPLVDRTRDNLFLRGRWGELIAHFRYAFICKGLMFRFLFVTDERLKNVFVGNESAKVKPKEERESTKSYNSLSDLVCDHDLLIVMLGFLGHKNIAMPGVLKETLMLREVQHKPTWIVDKADYPFVVGHLAYSEDVSDYIFSHFSALDIGSASSTTGPEPTPQVVESERVSESWKDVPEGALSVDSEDHDELADLLGEPVPSFKKRANKPFKFKRRPSGGGPAGGF